jgi:hypothetical protein
VTPDRKVEFFGKLKPGQAFKDLGHEWTAPLNKYFTSPENLDKLKAMQIFSSLLMDLTLPTLMVYFMLSGGETWRIPVEFCFLYGLRLTCLSVFAMETPEGFYWENPGFFSLTVPYGWTNDFFFSGHVSSANLCLLEFNLARKKHQGQARKQTFHTVMFVTSCCSLVA